MQQHNTALDFQQISQYRNKSYEELIMAGLSQIQAQIILREIISEELQLEISKLSIHNDQEKMDDIMNYLAYSNILTYQEFISTKFTDEQLNEFDFNLNEYQTKKLIPYTFDQKQLPILKAQKKNIFLDNTQCTILMLGQTGSGKSTFINMLSNFLLLEKVESNYRVKLVYEQNLLKTQSQTDKLQNYVLYSRRLKKVVNLIDTPGFGDTRGIKEDERITNDLQKLLTDEINQIDMVCLVKKESDNRLDDVNKYVIGKIFELFGKDIVKNFQIILTHSQFYDQPEVINLFEEEQDFRQIYDQINEPKFLQFEIDNKRVLYSQNKTKFTENWNNCQLLFDKINNLKPQCLLQTKQVLEDRQQLLTQLDNLGMELNNNLNRMNLLQQHFQSMGQNQLQKFKEVYLKRIPIPEGSFITNCLICKVTCHYPCFIEQDQFKNKCFAMTNGVCRICKLKCSWEQHINNNFRYEYHEQELEQVQRDSIQIVNEYQQQLSDFIKNQDQMIQILQKISQTALLPKSHQYIIGYIEFTISKEQDDKNNGYQERIEQLNKIKYKIEQLEKNHINTLIAPLMNVIDDNQLRITLQKVKSQISEQH